MIMSFEHWNQFVESFKADRNCYQGRTKEGEQGNEQKEKSAAISEAEPDPDRPTGKAAR